jgi:hypothetical protein
MQEQVAREPEFNPLDILKRNGGYMPFWDLVRVVSEQSKTDTETAYNHVMDLIKNKVLIKIVLRREKQRCKWLRSIIPHYGSTWLARSRDAALAFVNRITLDALRAIDEIDIEKNPNVIKGDHKRKVRDFRDEILLTQLGIRPWEIASLNQKPTQPLASQVP